MPPAKPAFYRPLTMLGDFWTELAVLLHSVPRIQGVDSAFDTDLEASSGQGAVEFP